MIDRRDLIGFRNASRILCDAVNAEFDGYPFVRVEEPGQRHWFGIALQALPKDPTQIWVREDQISIQTVPVEFCRIVCAGIPPALRDMRRQYLRRKP